MTNKRCNEMTHMEGESSPRREHCDAMTFNGFDFCSEHLKVPVRVGTVKEEIIEVLSHRADTASHLSGASDYRGEWDKFHKDEHVCNSLIKRFEAADKNQLILSAYEIEEILLAFSSAYSNASEARRLCFEQHYTQPIQKPALENVTF